MNVYDDPLTDEELSALDSAFANLVGNSNVSVSCTYKAKTGRSVNYETGAITEQESTATVNAIRIEPSKILVEALGIGDSDYLLIVRKADLDAESITPRLWDTVTIDSEEFSISKIWTPIPSKHYRFAISRKGNP